MIKINKNIADIPESLIPAIEDMFSSGQIPRTSKTTHQRRIELIDAGEYIDNPNYNNRYKTSDIRDKLKKIYNGKCAFCEQKEEQLHVEHFRPKKIYYWLAYSWDNLILACPKCNEHKGTNFDTRGNKVIFENNDANINNINSLSSGYDQLERPKMVNPETMDPQDHITFSKNGKMDSTQDNCKHTITACNLSRSNLNDERRKILDTFKKEVISELVYRSDKTSQIEAIALLVRQFIRFSQDLSNEYIAFRSYSIKNEWLNDIIKDELSP